MYVPYGGNGGWSRPTLAGRRRYEISSRSCRRRSTLAKRDAQRRYVEIGELVALERIRDDAEMLDRGSFAVGPFARLGADQVAARDRKTRGAITNLFGSQAAFQVATMSLALSAGDWIERIRYPDPRNHASVDSWLDALLLAESERGPRHQGEPRLTYGFLWALWLSAVPYGLWSSRVSRASMDEHVEWQRKLAAAIVAAIDHFGLSLRQGVRIEDIAGALASMIEGAWLNQCLTTTHPIDSSEPISSVLRRSGRFIWEGATQPRTEPAGEAGSRGNPG